MCETTWLDLTYLLFPLLINFHLILHIICVTIKHSLPLRGRSPVPPVDPTYRDTRTADLRRSRPRHGVNRHAHPCSPCDILPWISARPGFLSGAGTGLSRSPAPRKRSATTQTTYAALRRGTCCTLCSRLRPQLRRWKAASEAPQRGRGRRMRFCYSQLELAALPEVEGDAQKNDILTGRVSPKLALDATKEGGS